MANLLEREQLLPYRIERVFEFFADARNLELLTPPWLSFRILTRAPIRMAPGTIIDYELRWRFFRIAWRTEITDWTPPYEFSDEQVKGPYKLWRHTHSFREVPGGTVMSDRVTYQLPLGPLGAIAHWLRVRGDLNRIFDYRASAIRGALQAHFAAR